MIKFEIIADTAQDFDDHFTGLAAVMGLFRSPSPVLSAEAPLAIAAPTDASKTDVPQADAQVKRTRRTKAQMEADAAAAAAAGQQSAPASEEAPVEPGKPDDSSTQTSSSESVTTPPTENASSVGEETPAENVVADADAPTVDALRAFAGPLVQSQPGFREKLAATLKAQNVKAISELTPAGRVAFADALGYVA